MHTYKKVISKIYKEFQTLNKKKRDRAVIKNSLVALTENMVAHNSPVTGEMRPSSGLLRYCINVVHTHTCMKIPIQYGSR